MTRPTRLRPLALVAALWFAGCGGSSPATAPSEPAGDPPREAGALDDAKPGEHGCGSCAVRVCAAGGAISGLRVELKLTTDLKVTRYDRATVRIASANGGGEVFPLDPGKIVVGTATVQQIAGEKLSAMKSPSDAKGASAALMLYWTTPSGPGAQQLPIAVEAGACP